jgi:hypothetical protein
MLHGHLKPLWIISILLPQHPFQVRGFIIRSNTKGSQSVLSGFPNWGFGQLSPKCRYLPLYNSKWYDSKAKWKLIHFPNILKQQNLKKDAFGWNIMHTYWLLWKKIREKQWKHHFIDSNLTNSFSFRPSLPSPSYQPTNKPPFMHIIPSKWL